ncbi:putative low-specificity L-threonine aldolase like protein [Argiope bruennichi]|uniref:Putative low-specificity L-threonine aldolase like protein n=1 Tax=Argiope bruennichi TaxID=94029 RepID=A0A8T0E9U5_ARGBR|nr:putative low-specificity L-threonine aldolase like protein [Argiope bruennichi]
MAREIDLRSDSVTKPTPAMREAMKNAVVGDDMYKEDPTNWKRKSPVCLERRMPSLFPQERWEILLPLGGLHVSCVRTQEDGTFNLEELKEKIRPRIPHIRSSSKMDVEYPEPSTALICLENPHNILGGRILPISFIQQVCSLAGSNGIPVHMDGARIINASVQCGVPVHEIVKDCASVMMCLSKGVGAPIGSVVAGSKHFIERVHKYRKALGGGMRQAGVMAAAALVGLKSAEERMRTDNQRTKKLAQDIHDLQSNLVTCDPDLVETNMLLLQFPSPDFTSQDFVKRMTQVKKGDNEQVIVKASLWFKNRVRCVLHSDLTQEDVDCAMKKIRDIVS